MDERSCFGRRCIRAPNAYRPCGGLTQMGTQCLNALMCYPPDLRRRLVINRRGRSFPTAGTSATATPSRRHHSVWQRGPGCVHVTLDPTTRCGDSPSSHTPSEFLPIHGLDIGAADNVDLAPGREPVRFAHPVRAELVGVEFAMQPRGPAPKSWYAGTFGLHDTGRKFASWAGGWA